MLKPAYDWLLAGTFPLPKMVNSGLFLSAIDRADWLREVCADAGKLFVVLPDEQMAGGVIAVSDLALVDDFDPIRHVERPRPDLSTGARRLKVAADFDPARVGEPTDTGVMGDIVLYDGAAGILIGDDGSKAHVLREGHKISKWSLSNVSFRHPPQTNGSDFMARIALHADGSLDRQAMIWLLGAEEFPA